MKFDYILGNPPYQENTQDTSDKSIYDKFMNESFKIGKVVELITPAKFLSEAGKTNKDWNKKMLMDPHFKVLWYEEDGTKIFGNTIIKGGVVVTLRDSTRKLGPIVEFTKYEEISSILDKVINKDKNNPSIMKIIGGQSKFDLDKLYEQYPESRQKIGSNGREKRLTTSIFKTLDIFNEERVNSNSVLIYGIEDLKRVKRYMDRNLLDNNSLLDNYKVLLPFSNGEGTLGERLSNPFIAKPNEGFTQSYISFGNTKSEYEAQNILKYLKTKFVRILLGVLKVTQHNSKKTWKYVPLQDFSENSDIDWNKSISEIDQQLYKKYGLDINDINFIETHVKEME